MEYLVSVALFAISSSVTPGPNNILVLTSGLNHGIRRSLPLLSGICTGFALMLLLVGVGLGQVFETFPFVITGIKVLGVTYLLYLAWIVAKSDDINTDNSHKVRLGFLKGALFQWVNAKAWVVAIGAISAFTIAEGSIVDQVLVISSIFLVLAFPCVGLWLVFGARLRGILHSSSHRKTFNISMAALLVVSVLPVIYDLVSRL